MSVDKSEHPVENDAVHKSLEHPYTLNICAPFPGMENPPTEEQMQKIRKDFESLRSLIWDT